MKHRFLKLSSFLCAMVFTASCTKENTGNPIEEELPLTFVDMESDWVRLSLMSSDKIEVMQADNGEVQHTVATDFPEDASYYTSSSGRYLTSINREESEVRFFDSGIQNHDDHGHKFTAKWLDFTLDSPLPTHYSSSGGHIVIFNDGDGSLTYINEEQLEIPAYRPTVFALEGTVAHHGAGFRLDNGMFATTFKNTDEPGGLPQMVKYVDANGNVIDDNGGIEVEKVHGDAVNGKYGVFGSTEGVILVDNQSNIDLIKNLDGLHSESGNWLSLVNGHDNSAMFYARAYSVGIYMIDPVNKSMVQLYEGADVFSDMFSFDGAYYMVHTSDNKIRVYDSNTGTLVTERIVEMATIPELSSKSLSEVDATMKGNAGFPVFSTSDDFLYVLAPNRTQIKVLKISDLEHVHTIELDTPIESMMKNGFSIDGDQNVIVNH